MTSRERRRLIQRLVWPTTLLAVGFALQQTAFVLAAWTGLTFRLYGVFQGIGDLVLLIGAVWLVIVLVRIAIAPRHPRR